MACVADIVSNAVRTSWTDSFFSGLVPITAMRGRSESRLTSTVLAVRPGRPSASQSATACSTVYPAMVRMPASSSACSSLSLSRTAALVWPLTFRRIRFPSGPKPSETTPHQRRAQDL